jgi:predicted TIM-barrel fold metal-dependent hydrolase
MRPFLGIAFVATAFAWLMPATAQEQPIFDAHLHYSAPAVEAYPLKQVLETLAKAGVRAVLVSSTPNDGTRLMFEQAGKAVTVIPFIRPYRNRSDMMTWYRSRKTLDLVKEELARGYYKGIGEFHVSGSGASTPEMRELVHFAVANNLWLHAHSDSTAIAGIMAHESRVRLVWAHCGFSEDEALVEAFLKRYPALMCELSYRSGISEGGKLTDTWRRLFTTYPDRFLLGSDTWVNERWLGYGDTMASYRAWLKHLPPDIAGKIAWGNGWNLWGPK